MPVKNIDLPTVVGKGYASFWKDKNRYVVLKGGRGSKKSTTTALRWIYLLMKYPLSNLLVIRKFQNTHSTSTFPQLLWAIKRLGVEHLWKVNNRTLQMTYIPTGQAIFFKGFDDPMNITSFTVAVGHLCWVWIEEAYQISNEEDFDKLDLSIRGALPEGYWKQIVMTFNPWSDKCWIKRRFCDNTPPNASVYTTNYLCNEFLDEADRQVFEYMKEHYPRRYRIEGLGEWGIAQGLVFQNFVEQEFDIQEDVYSVGQVSYDTYGRPSFASSFRGYFGLDFGYTNDPTAFVALAVNVQKKIIYVYDEIYKRQLSNQGIYDEIEFHGFAKEKITADSEDPRTIAELKRLGLTRIRGAKKGKGSVLAGIQKLQDYEIRVHPRCVNFLIEISNYVWDTDKKTGKEINKPIDEYNHLMDAMRYATEEINGDARAFALPNPDEARPTVTETEI